MRWRVLGLSVALFLSMVSLPAAARLDADPDEVLPPYRIGRGTDTVGTVERTAYDAFHSVWARLPSEVREPASENWPCDAYAMEPQPPTIPLSQAPPVCNPGGGDATPTAPLDALDVGPATGGGSGVEVRSPDPQDRPDATDPVPADVAAGDRPATHPGPGLGFIAAAILTAVALPAIWLYRRLSRDDLLDNPTRQAIHETITEEPGTTAAEIARTREMDYDTVRYHLRILDEFDEVSVRRVDGKDRYFLNHGRFGVTEQRVRSLLASDVRRRIVRSLARDGAQPAGRLAERADVAPSTASHHLSRLHDGEVVTRRRDGAEVRYALRDDVLDAVARALT